MMSPKGASPSGSLAEAERMPASTVLATAAEAQPDIPLTLGGFIDALGPRAFVLGILVSVLPCCVPGPPGWSSVFAIPILYLSVQMVLGSAHPWLPAAIRARRLDRDRLVGLIAKARPHLERFERWSRPRGPLWLRAVTRHMALAGIIVLALVLLVPLPWTNFWPGIAIALFSLGMIEEDPLLIAVAAGVGLFAIAVSVIVGGGILLAILYGWQGLAG